MYVEDELQKTNGTHTQPTRAPAGNPGSLPGSLPSEPGTDFVDQRFLHSTEEQLSLV